jgi:hypothetical protein
VWGTTPLRVVLLRSPPPPQLNHSLSIEFNCHSLHTSRSLHSLQCTPSYAGDPRFLTNRTEDISCLGWLCEMLKKYIFIFCYLLWPGLTVAITISPFPFPRNRTQGPSPVPCLPPANNNSTCVYARPPHRSRRTSPPTPSG